MTETPNRETHVSETYSDRYFFGDGAGYPNYLIEEGILTRHGSFYSELAKKILGKTGCMLDIGSAAGFILKGFSENGWVCTGIEPNESMARHARNKLGLDVRTGTIESLSIEEKFDCVTLIQAIAHLIDPVSVIEHLKKNLNEGAVVLVETWDYMSVAARLFGKQWHEYSPPSVLHWFSRQSCNFLFERNSYAKIASGRPAKKIAFAHAIALISFKNYNTVITKIASTVGRLLPQNMAIPYPFDDVFWTMYRLKH